MKPRRKPRQTEHAMQCAVIKACRYLEREYPEVKYLFAIPNGGHRHIAVAAKLKASGVKSGVPDLFLPLPIPGRSAGLWIEMKAPGGKVTQNQDDYLRFLSEVGFLTKVCYSAQDAVDEIKMYLERRRSVMAAINHDPVLG